MTSDYVPIDCDQHSILELLAIRRTKVAGRAYDENGTERAFEGTVADVTTRTKAEYLILNDAAGGTLAIRLDRLLSLIDPTGRQLWCQPRGRHG